MTQPVLVPVVLSSWRVQTSFTGSDSYWKDEELLEAFPSCEPGTMPWEFPIWISPIAIIFNLDGVSSLNMDGATVAGIFAGEITMWNDSAIAASNPGVALPELEITAVHRSDESGTSKNFTDYLAKVAENVWTVGAIEAWPVEYGGEGAQGYLGELFPQLPVVTGQSVMQTHHAPVTLEPLQ